MITELERGVNVTIPVVLSTDQVPSAGIVILVISPCASVTILVAPVRAIKLTVVGNMASPVVSFVNTGITTEVASCA